MGEAPQGFLLYVIFISCCCLQFTQHIYTGPHPCKLRIQSKHLTLFDVTHLNSTRAGRENWAYPRRRGAHLCSSSQDHVIGQHVRALVNSSPLRQWKTPDSRRNHQNKTVEVDTTKCHARASPDTFSGMPTDRHGKRHVEPAHGFIQVALPSDSLQLARFESATVMYDYDHVCISTIIYLCTVSFSCRSFVICEGILLAISTRLCPQSECLKLLVSLSCAFLAAALIRVLKVTTSCKPKVNLHRREVDVQRMLASHNVVPFFLSNYQCHCHKLKSDQSSLLSCLYRCNHPQPW